MTRAAILLAAGVVLSTIAAVRLGETGWTALVAAAIMAFALLGSGELIRRSPAGRPTTRRAAVLLGVAVLAASTAVLSRRPSDLAMLMPVLGAASGGGLLAVAVRKGQA